MKKDLLNVGGVFPYHHCRVRMYVHQNPKPILIVKLASVGSLANILKESLLKKSGGLLMLLHLLRSHHPCNSAIAEELKSALLPISSPNTHRTFNYVERFFRIKGVDRSLVR